MTNYFTSSINDLDAFIAIENGQTIISDKVDNTSIDKLAEKHSASQVGNKAELFKRLVDYAKHAQSTKAYKEMYKHVLDGLTALQTNERESRRDVRLALLQTIQKENLVNPLDGDKDKRDYPLPPFMSFEGQTKVFYDKAQVLEYCLKHMPEFITVDFDAFEKVAAKTNGWRDNTGKSIFDDENKPLPPVTVGRVAREVLSGDIEALPDKLGEIEFESSDELNQFFIDVWFLHEFNTSEKDASIRFIETYLPQYLDVFEAWASLNYEMPF